MINPEKAVKKNKLSLVKGPFFILKTPAFLFKVIEAERPDAILLSFGGQTALNCGIQLKEKGVLEQYNVAVLGTPVKSIEWTEDRKMFSDKMEQIEERVAPSKVAYTVEEVLLVTLLLSVYLLLAKVNMQ